MNKTQNTLSTKALILLAACALWASPAAADQVFFDDVIVGGSICVGLDCSNGESFGFDTIRMKENNLRIRAQDTSTSASFPSVDWQITFNETSNGGLNKFSIDDLDGSKTPFTIEAGAATNSLYVEADGDLGLGTNNPVVDLHVKSGNTPTLRLEQDGSSGFSPQTWDVAGNEAGFFIRDATNGSTLPFRIRPGAVASMIDISGNDRVGIGTDSPTGLLHVQRSGTDIPLFVVQNDEAPGEVVVATFRTDSVDEVPTFQLSNGTTGRRVMGLGGGDIAVAHTSGNEGNIGIAGCHDSDTDFTIGGTGVGCNTGTFSEINAGAAQFTVSSSRSIKENLEPVAGNDILEKISEIDVYTYDFIEGEKDKLGLMAEDFHAVFGRGSDKMLDGQDVQMALWLAVKQLTEKVSDLEAQLAAKDALD